MAEHARRYCYIIVLFQCGDSEWSRVNNLEYCFDDSVSKNYFIMNLIIISFLVRL